MNIRRVVSAPIRYLRRITEQQRRAMFAAMGNRHSRVLRAEGRRVRTFRRYNTARGLIQNMVDIKGPLHQQVDYAEASLRTAIEAGSREGARKVARAYTKVIRKQATKIEDRYLSGVVDTAVRRKGREILRQQGHLFPGDSPLSNIGRHGRILYEDGLQVLANPRSSLAPTKIPLTHEASWLVRARAVKNMEAARSLTTVSKRSLSGRPVIMRRPKDAADTIRRMKAIRAQAIDPDYMYSAIPTKARSSQPVQSAKKYEQWVRQTTQHERDALDSLDPVTGAASRKISTRLKALHQIRVKELRQQAAIQVEGDTRYAKRTILSKGSVKPGRVVRGSSQIETTPKIVSTAPKVINPEARLRKSLIEKGWTPAQINNYFERRQMADAYYKRRGL